MVSIEWSIFMIRASIGSAGGVGAGLDAATGTLTMGLVGPIPYRCWIVSITGIVMVDGQKWEVS
jgi:hypothetical protein